jgi:hypothetical protein
MILRTTRALVTVAALLAPSVASSDPGDLLWLDTQGTAHDDHAEELTVAGATVAVAGIKRVSAMETRFWVRAYDAKTGVFLFEDDALAGFALSLASLGSRIFATGFAGGGFFTRAYSARTGELLWEDPRNLLGVATDVAVGRGRVFAVGSNTSGFQVRAYDATSGAVQWTQPHQFAFDTANAIAASRSRVFAVGSSMPGPLHSDGAIHARNAASGSFLWDDLVDYANHSDHFVDVTVARGAVVVAGDAGTPFATKFYLRAYADDDAEEVLWDFDDLPAGGAATAITSKGSRVYAAGWIENLSGDTDVYVRTVDARTGNLLWEESFDLAGDDDAASSVAVVGKSLLVGGYGVNGQDGEDLVLLSYDARKGGLPRWHVVADRDGLDDGAVAVAGKGATALVASDVTSLLSGTNLQVRAHALR